MQVVETRATLLEEDSRRWQRRYAHRPPETNPILADLVEHWHLDRVKFFGKNRRAIDALEARQLVGDWIHDETHVAMGATCRHGRTPSGSERCAYCAECSENEVVPSSAERSQTRTNVERVQELRRVLTERTEAVRKAREAAA